MTNRNETLEVDGETCRWKCLYNQYGAEICQWKTDSEPEDECQSEISYFQWIPYVLIIQVLIHIVNGHNLSKKSPYGLGLTNK